MNRPSHALPSGPAPPPAPEWVLESIRNHNVPVKRSYVLAEPPPLKPSSTAAGAEAAAAAAASGTPTVAAGGGAAAAVAATSTQGAETVRAGAATTEDLHFDSKEAAAVRSAVPARDISLTLTTADATLFTGVRQLKLRVAKARQLCR
jgi:hypothetical protein